MEPTRQTIPGLTSAPETNDGDFDSFRRVVRYSHIFSSAVNEVLEQRYLDDVAGEPISLTQFHLLKLIALDGAHHVGEVAEFLGVSSPAASKTIDRLVRQGLLTRAECQGDRRAILLSASPAGRQLIRHYEQHKAERLRPVLKRFGKDEIEQFGDLLERFTILLFRAEPSRRDYCLRCAAYCVENCPINEITGFCPFEKILARDRSSGHAPEELS